MPCWCTLIKSCSNIRRTSAVYPAPRRSEVRPLRSEKVSRQQPSSLSSCVMRASSSTQIPWIQRTPHNPLRGAQETDRDGRARGSRREEGRQQTAFETESHLFKSRRPSSLCFPQVHHRQSAFHLSDPFSAFCTPRLSPLHESRLVQQRVWMCSTWGLGRRRKS